MKHLLLLALMSACSNNYAQSSIPKDQYVILPFDKDGYAIFAKNSIPATLNDSDFVVIDHLLSVSIKKYNREGTAEYHKMVKECPAIQFQRKDFIIKFKKYYRQYVVVTNAKGEKEVWINCFCSIQLMDNWEKQVIFVEDGGNCFFNMRINLTKKLVTDFFVNGKV